MATGYWETDFHFSDEEIAELRAIVDDPEFISRLETAGGVYFTKRRIDRDRKVSEERSNLRDLSRQIQDLHHALGNLDAGTKDVVKTILGNELRNNLRRLENDIELGRRSPEGKTKHEQEAPRNLTWREARILTSCDILLTSSATGAFNRCVSIVSDELPETTRNWVREYLSHCQG